MQQTETAGGTAWGELSTAVTPVGDTAPREGAAWFQVKPRLANGVVVGGSMARQGYVAVARKYLLYPAVQPGGPEVFMAGRPAARDGASAGVRPGAGR